VVGADGAGKTTVADRLRTLSERPMSYVYLGPAIGSSSHALPTSRLIAWLKRRRLKEHASDWGSTPPDELLTEEAGKKVARGRVFKALGLVNRVAEEWFRQAIVAYHRLRGRIVICDRHYLYEYCPSPPDAKKKDDILSVRIHDWLLARFYPRPHVTLFLDAPADVLYRRKPEWPVEYVEKQRERIRQQGRYMPEFIRIDVTAPLEEVIAEARERLTRFEQGRRAPSESTPVARS
jgi:thymidylate kinase